MAFKQCTLCARKWQTQEEFLSDPEVSLLGLQVSFGSLLQGLVLFNHSCKTTFAVEVSCFTNLYQGPVYTESAAGSEQCPEYCLHIRELKPCPAKCACAFAREILQVIRHFPKQQKG